MTPTTHRSVPQRVAAGLACTLLTGGRGFVAGSLLGVLVLGTIQTFISFDGTLSSWWTKIAIDVLLLAFVVLQRLVTRRQP